MTVWSFTFVSKICTCIVVSEKFSGPGVVVATGHSAGFDANLDQELHSYNNQVLTFLTVVTQFLPATVQYKYNDIVDYVSDVLTRQSIYN